MLLGRLIGTCRVFAAVIAFAPGTTVWGQNASNIVARPVETATATTAPAETPSATPTPADPLLDQIDRAIEVNSHRYLRANHNSPWQIFHGVLAYRQQFLLQVGDQKMPAIDWIATADARYHNRPWILVTQHGAKFHPYSGVPMAFEGHPSQSLALLSESHLPPDFKFRVSGRDVTIADMLQNSMMEVNNREETTWVLWALINYMPVDKQWVNQSGEPWSIERLVQHEVAAHTPTRPCGGNHNLFVLCRARDKYLATGQPLRGVWFEANQKINQYVEYARTMQNRDGSFSSNFYKGPGYTNDMNSRFNTTGHTLEFLSIALPNERLKEPWVRNAAQVLSAELIQHKSVSVDPGPLYHSLNALMNYRDRVRPKVTAPEIAQAPQPEPQPAPQPAPQPVATPTSPPTVGEAPKTEPTPQQAATTPPKAPQSEPVLELPATTKPANASPTTTAPARLTPGIEQVAKPVPTVATPLPVSLNPAALNPGALPVITPAAPITRPAAESPPVSALEPANRP
jgi:hypothetical protein